jgi:conjugative relaxase-like TrwC/TraI family protein
MLRIQPIANAEQAASYYAKSDAGYYLTPEANRREWGGKAADLLGLQGEPEFEQFKRLIAGLDPRDGSQLTAKLIEDRIPGWDINVHCPKGVTTAIERGDSRLAEVLWEAARETMTQDIEPLATTRVRKGGKDADRVTGNLAWFAVEHYETRPAKDDNMPDWQRHLHFVVMNITRDEVEGEWKAVKFRPVMDLKKLFDRRFNARFSKKAADLGYDIETKWDLGGKGGRKYVTWDIKGIPKPVLERFSRRSKEVEQAEAKLVAAMKERDPSAPDRLSEVARDKLGATTRSSKRKELTLDDLREYWDSRITEEEGDKIARVIERAKRGLNPKMEPKVAQAVEFSLKHHFQGSSVVPFNDLAITAVERSMGTALPADIEAEANRQGVLRQGADATTKEVLAEEAKVIGFAREGRGCWRPMGPKAEPDLSKLSADQQAAVRHIWRSPDRVIMVEGDAGTGKTDAMQVTIPGIDKLGVFLAPSASASRGTLRDKGFVNADTIARFLIDDTFQALARDGFIYIDEAPLAGIRQIAQVFDKAKELNARVILQGDRKQHQAPGQRGAVFDLLPEFAGVPVARLTTIWRQKHKDYKRAVAAIAGGDVLAGHDILSKLGWVKETSGPDHNQPLVDDYMAAIGQKKPGGKQAEVLVVAPTHREIEEVTSALRARMKERGMLGEERVFTRLEALRWTDAEKSDPGQYTGTETVQFHRSSGRFRAGMRVSSTQIMDQAGSLNPEHFSVYTESVVRLAAGDTIRITANGRDKTGRHRLDNGSVYKVAGFSKAGGIVLSNGWELTGDFGHMAHGYCTTSDGSQGRTVDHVLISMGRESRPAVHAAQYYVSASRGRESCRIYTDLPQAELKEAIRQSHRRKSATGLMGEGKRPPPAVARPQDRVRQLMERARAAYRYMHRKVAGVVKDPFRQRGMEHGR